MSIKRIRTSKNLKQRELAEQLNINRSTIAKWETGTSMPRADTLLKIAEILECTVDELLEVNKTND